MKHAHQKAMEYNHSSYKYVQKQLAKLRANLYISIYSPPPPPPPLISPLRHYGEGYALAAALT